MDLSTLNDNIRKGLEQAGYDPVIIGNLFYDHLEKEFWKKPLNKLFQRKRERLAEVARRSHSMFEIGVNGGHSALLCLQANPDLKYTGNDLCEFLPSIPQCHPEVYVPIAMKFLIESFQNRVSFLVGNSLVTVPRFVKTSTAKFDLIHIDGEKSTYLKNYEDIAPLCDPGAYIVFDDTQQKPIKQMVDGLLRKGVLQRAPDFPFENGEYTHEILIHP